jgi:cytochrome c oxidase subunit 4
MALQLVRSAVLAKGVQLPWKGGVVYCVNHYHGRSMIGKREVVGFGVNGDYSYFDRMDYPFPSIRFKEIGTDMAALKAKENGCWKQLTLEEKKKLYRTSFRQTFAEMKAPTGEWKSVLAGVLTMMASTLWIYVLIKKFVYGPMPESTSAENKRKQLEHYIRLRIDPIEGISSKWDYEKNQWKE